MLFDNTVSISWCQIGGQVNKQQKHKMENSYLTVETRTLNHFNSENFNPNTRQNPIIKSTIIASSFQSFDALKHQIFVPSSLCDIKAQNQNAMFTLYHQFVSRLIQNRHFQQTIINELKFEGITTPAKAVRVSIKSLIQQKSSNGKQVTSMEDFNTLLKKRISIDIIQSNLSLQSFGSFHYNSQTTFESQTLSLSREFIHQIFQNPSPFIMVQSLCLLLKYLWRTKVTLTSQNCVKLLLTSTMLAFKLCYDQQVSGIGYYYASVINEDSKQVSKLEGRFINQLGFETDISKEQYFVVSTYLLSK